MTQATAPLTYAERIKLNQQQQQTKHLWLEGILDNPLWLVALGALHFALAFGVREFGLGIVGQAHGILTLLIGLYFASNKRYPVSYAVYIAAYIAGCEVMWRQNDFPLFWESGKYFMILIMMVSWMRERTKLKAPTLAIIYIALLTPGIFFTIAQEPNIKALLSPHATGPVALFFTLLFFAQQRFTTDELRRILFMFAIPVVAIAGIVDYRVTNFDIRWTGDSNNAASGDFGANQVSTALGIGWASLLIAGVLLLDKLPRRTIMLMGGILGITIVWMIVQNFFTFSRGGLFGSLLAVGGMFLVLLISRRKQFITLMVIIAGLIVVIAVFPALDRTTQGNLSRRYNEEIINQQGELALTNRERIIEHELRLFQEFPVLGVGIGRGAQVRGSRFGFRIAPHTEYTRLLAEHGIFGLGVNVLFVVLAIDAFRKQRNPIGRALVVALGLWAAFYMFHSATRTVAPAFALGLAYASLAVDLDPKEVAAQVRRVIPLKVNTTYLPRTTPQGQPAPGGD
jgi:hypothetical protein